MLSSSAVLHEVTALVALMQPRPSVMATPLTGTTLAT
jgi:hypothetical protein